MSFMDRKKRQQDKFMELQKKLEDWSDAMGEDSSDKEYYVKSPTRLQDHRDMNFQLHHHKMEQVLYYITHNLIIDIKLEIQSITRRESKKTRYAMTKSSDKVSSYDGLKRKYKVSTLKSLELRYRKLILMAFDMNDGLYSFDAWVSLICRHQSPEEIYEGEYGELKDAINELVSPSGDFPKFHKISGYKKAKTHVNSVERFM